MAQLTEQQQRWIDWGNRLDEDGFWRYTGADERGNGHVEPADWRAAKRAWLMEQRAGDAKLPQTAYTEALMRESIACIMFGLHAPPTPAERDRAIAHGVVLENVMAKLVEANAAKRGNMAAARKARVAIGRPKQALRVTSPDGTVVNVLGWDAAAAACGKSAASLKARLSQVARFEGKAVNKVIVGRRRDGSDCWTVERVGTNNALLQEPCQKDENDVHEKDGAS